MLSQSEVALRVVAVMKEAMTQVLAGTLSVPSKVQIARQWPDPDAR